MRGTGADRPVVARKPGNAGGATGTDHPVSVEGQPPVWREEPEREPKPEANGKPFAISKRAVWEAWKQVRANRGAAGVDEESIAEFEADPQGKLFKLWNRMSSGSYLPPPVRAVELPKAGGQGVRRLGVLTVADRVAQTVARLYLEPRGTDLPSRLLRLSAGALGARCVGTLSRAMLEQQLGDRPRRPVVL